MGFCKKCNHPINIVNGKTMVIYDDLGVMASPCVPCNIEKDNNKKESTFSCPKCYKGFDDYFMMERHYFGHYKDLLDKKVR